MEFVRSCLPVILAIGLSTLAVVAGDDPDPEKTAAEAIRAAADAEVHGVGVYEPASSGFATTDVTDWPKLVAALRGRQGVAGRVWELLPEETRKLLANDKIVGTLAAPQPTPESLTLKAEVANGLRKILPRADYYTEEAFKMVELGKEVKALVKLGKDRSPIHTILLNRTLFTICFPGAISEIPRDYHVVRVKVEAGKDAILVLSSCRECRWEVEVEKGSIKGVVLGGYRYQEIAGTEAPVLYRAYYGRNGTPVKLGGDYLQAHDPKEERFQDLERAVKELTGRTLTSFQGKYTAPVEPFVIRPGAK